MIEFFILNCCLCVVQIKAGAIMNCVCLIVLQLALNTWGYVYFNLHEFPEWAGGAMLNATYSNISLAYS